MADKKLIDEIVVKDLEDGSALRVEVFECKELGNESKPGLQMLHMGQFSNFEPVMAERWAYKLRKENQKEMLLDSSWTFHEDQYIKVYFLPGAPAKAKVIVKTRSSKPQEKTYPLPFDAE
jgi:hypothetical protein